MEVSVEEVRRLLDRGLVPGAVRLIDCREEDEFAICRLPAAELVPLSSFGGRDFSGLSEEGKAAVVYCHHGMRSAHAALYLRGKGIARAFSMRGGIDLWALEIDAGMARY